MHFKIRFGAIGCLVVLSLGCSPMTSPIVEAPKFDSGFALEAESDEDRQDEAVLYPIRLRDHAGEVSQDQPLGVLAEMDQEDDEDDWSRYIYFKPKKREGLKADFVFEIPNGFVPADGPVRFEIGFKGSGKKEQSWTFSILSHSDDEWVKVGDNTNAKPWVWSVLHMETMDLQPYLKNGRFTVRYATSEQGEQDSKIDFFSATLRGIDRRDSIDDIEPLPALPHTNPGEPRFLQGVTVDDIENIDAIVEALRRLPVKITARIVFDEFVPAEYYLDAVRQISEVAHVMGEIVDSYYIKEYSVDAFADRVKEYLDLLGPHVEIWEIGNEVNGEWVGSTQDSVEKFRRGYELVEQAGGKTALTLFYNDGCWTRRNNEIFVWAEDNVPLEVRSGLDYVLVSYYEDDCEGAEPNWQSVFERISRLFPESLVGMGEVGTLKKHAKEPMIRKYYSLDVDVPNYVGGYFWWYFKQDMVPHTKPLWKVLYNAMNPDD